MEQDKGASADADRAAGPSDLSPASGSSQGSVPSADDGWIEWSGGECPVPPKTIVETRHRSGDECLLAKGPADDNSYGEGPWTAGRWGRKAWLHEADGFSSVDIVAYRIVEEPSA